MSVNTYGSGLYSGDNIQMIDDNHLSKTNNQEGHTPKRLRPNPSTNNQNQTINHNLASPTPFSPGDFVIQSKNEGGHLYHSNCNKSVSYSTPIATSAQILNPTNKTNQNTSRHNKCNNNAGITKNKNNKIDEDVVITNIVTPQKIKVKPPNLNMD